MAENKGPEELIDSGSFKMNSEDYHKIAPSVIKNSIYKVYSVATRVDENPEIVTVEISSVTDDSEDIEISFSFDRSPRHGAALQFALAHLYSNGKELVSVTHTEVIDDTRHFYVITKDSPKAG